MFNDLALSRDLMGHFYEEKRLDETSSLRKMTAMVLQRSSWPFAARKTDILLPGWVNDTTALLWARAHVVFVFVDARRPVHVYAVLQGEASGPNPGLGSCPWYRGLESAVQGRGERAFRQPVSGSHFAAIQ